MLVVLAACSTGVHHAEVLSTPFPGVVLSAHAQNERCSTQGCGFVYRVRITNPTGRDANVQRCRTVSGKPVRVVPILGIAGFRVPPHATRTARTGFAFPIEKSAVQDLVGQRLNCIGLDWHGNPPV
jgi:hypothetical protein